MVARVALPPEERARRDRESWARSRARTGNWSSRAYNLAVQDAARWVRKNRPDLWDALYQARCAEQQARVAADAAAGDCPHDTVEIVETAVFAVVCTGCHALLGSTTRGEAPAGYQVFTGDGGRVAFRRTATSTAETVATATRRVRGG